MSESDDCPMSEIRNKPGIIGSKAKKRIQNDTQHNNKQSKVFLFTDFNKIKFNIKHLQVENVDNFSENFWFVVSVLRGSNKANLQSHFFCCLRLRFKRRILFLRH